MSDNLLYKTAFSMLKGLNLTLGKSLLSIVGSEENFFTASESELKAVLADSNKLLSHEIREDALETAKKELDYISFHNIKPIYFSDDNYPCRMLECDDAPLMIYGVGKCNLNATHIVSIVGTRHATPYGTTFVDNLVEELAKKIPDLLIVSGLAYGIDIAAHRAALKNGIPTVAVFGHGLSTVYPAMHRNDAAAIARAGGMILTEYRHDVKGLAPYFLARNRIIAGMADCTVVAESAQSGGAMVTARIASSYNRDVFALPGRCTDKYSRGCNRLIHRNVAALIESVDDLIDTMQWTPNPVEGDQQALPLQLNEREQSVYDYLKVKTEARLNQISIDLNLPVGQLMSVLIDLEFKGIIVPYPGALYRLKRP